MDDQTALGFNTICNFIRDLNASFGPKQKSLMLYGHLIEKTGLIHIEPVKKHIQLFRKFVKTNEDAILGRDKKLLKTTRINYSEKVAIELSSIFQMCSRDEEECIWNHLLTISAILNPECQAKQVLKELKEKASATSSGGDKEDNFLKNIMDKIGTHAASADGQEDMNPMNMIGSLMSSGVFNEIFQGLSGGMNDGNLDIGKLMGSMQGMMNEINKMMKDKMPEEPSASTTTAEVPALPGSS